MDLCRLVSILLQGAFGGNGNGYLLDEELAEATKTGKPSLLSKDGGSTQDKGSNPKKLGYQNSAYNTKGSYGKGGAYSYGFYSPAYQYPRYGYNGSYASGKTNNLHYQYLVCSYFIIQFGSYQLAM